MLPWSSCLEGTSRRCRPGLAAVWSVVRRPEGEQASCWVGSRGRLLVVTLLGETAYQREAGPSKWAHPDASPPASSPPGQREEQRTPLAPRRSPSRTRTPPSSSSSSSSSSSVKRTHRNGRDPAHPWVFSCPMCRKDFSTSKGLTVHQRLSHGPGRSQRAVRPFSCSVCGKHFLRSSSLKPHMSIHVGEPYACTQCGRRYSCRGNLGRHQALCNAASST